MILNDFIDKVFNRYKCTAPDVDDKKEEFTSVLISRSEKIDFQKLLDLIAKEHESDFTPSASKVLEWSHRCYKSEFKKLNNRIKQVKFRNTLTGLVRSTDAFEGNYTEEQLLKWKCAVSGHNNWEIAEVY